MNLLARHRIRYTAPRRVETSNSRGHVRQFVVFLRLCQTCFGREGGGHGATHDRRETAAIQHPARGKTPADCCSVSTLLAALRLDARRNASDCKAFQVSQQERFMAHPASTNPGAAAPIIPPMSDEDLASMAGHDFAAQITMREVQEAEAAYEERWGVKRRIALISLTRTKVELVAGFTKGDNGPELLMEMIEHVQDWAAHLRDGLDVAEAATARLTVACAAAMQHLETQAGA